VPPESSARGSRRSARTERALKLVGVAVPIPVPAALTYSVPEGVVAPLGPGQRVRVKVGKRSLTGVVWSHGDEGAGEREVRPIEAVLDRAPILTPELLDLARFVSEYYLAPIGEVLASMIPADLPPWGDRAVALTAAGALATPRDHLDRLLRDRLLEKGRQRVGELAETVDDPQLEARIARWIVEGRLVDLGAEATGRRYVTAWSLAGAEVEALRGRCGRSPRGRAVVDWLAALGRPASAAELRAETGVGDAVVRRLERLGILQSFRQVERSDLDRHLLAGRAAGEAPVELHPEQAGAELAIRGGLESRQFARFLLHGVTGSGKTEVYLRAVGATLELGRSAILLVPEIALVPALARAARDRFGTRLAVLHSGLSTNERAGEWARLRGGEARVVVGTRSALFAPVTDLGLIVVDEEQDAAYKQEVAPRYHGRDLALVRCRAAGAVVVLASATPSLEARHAAARPGWTVLRLHARVGAGRLPDGILVDLRQEPRGARSGELLFSARLLAELGEALSRGHQAILLRNRRGYAPMLLCRACGEDFRCEACGLPRTYHRRAGRLVCHWCGSAQTAPTACPACRAEALDPMGAGTERVEEELAARFPGVAVDVLDRDATRRIGGAAAVLERFRSGRTQVLVGTQMLSKGHHFPGVVLTAVLAADAYLGFPDFRAVERTYALLTQLAGRAGRGELPGRVVLQTFHPEHYAIRAALAHDDEAFAEQEMRFRRLFDYPPFSRMALLWSRDRDRERAWTRIRELAERIRRQPSAAGLRLTGPAPAPLERLKGEWRFQLAVRGASGRDLRAALAAVLAERRDPGVAVDIDPYQLL
jgi:primosomal protein N' (replication factor Y) (superfamily II helicase)